VVLPTATVGSRLPLVPKWKWNLTGTYQLPLPPGVGRVSMSATFSRVTNIMYAPGPYGIIDGVGLLSASLNWNSVNGTPIDISVFGTNLTGEQYFTGVNDLSASGGFVSKYFGDPRMYGIRVKYSFGR
jgi:iron complex outermembrane receptor protein